MISSHDCNSDLSCGDDDLISLLNFAECTTDPELSVQEGTSQNDEGTEYRPQKRRRIPKSSKIQFNTQALMEVLVGQNQVHAIRARRAQPILYAFPHYDKCDSLLYFPNAISRHVNSGDFSKLSSLFLTHMDKSCDINIDMMGYKPNYRNFAEVFKFSSYLYPDLIMCVNTTKVSENQIKSTILSKHSELQSIYKAIEHSSINDDMVGNTILKLCSKDNLKTRVKRIDLPKQEVEHIESLIDNDANRVVYMNLELTITFNDLNKKITHLEFDQHVTSVAEICNF